MNISRRESIKFCIGLLAAWPLSKLHAVEQVLANPPGPNGNFDYIYSNPRLRDAFLDFYTNVFHLYPENKIHELTQNLTGKYQTDEAVYRNLQLALRDIKPFLANVRYALPALAKQKKVMTEQTLQLIDASSRYEGYMEIGTTGRYIDRLENALDIKGKIYLLHNREARYGPEDIVERGQLTKLGQFVDMGDYSSRFTKTVDSNSLDLVTVYIGFHHCPKNKRAEFISSVRDVMKPGGKLILRDHDAANEDLFRVAALAHDTFNAGTHQSWETNIKEVRNFYSLKFIVAYLEKLGLKYGGKVLFQKGDPTRNGLMVFTRV